MLKITKIPPSLSREYYIMNFVIIYYLSTYVISKFMYIMTKKFKGEYEL